MLSEHTLGAAPVCKRQASAKGGGGVGGNAAGNTAGNGAGKLPGNFNMFTAAARGMAAGSKAMAPQPANASTKGPVAPLRVNSLPKVTAEGIGGAIGPPSKGLAPIARMASFQGREHYSSHALLGQLGGGGAATSTASRAFVFRRDDKTTD